jgi:hypothetical protein
MTLINPFTLLNQIEDKIKQTIKIGQKYKSQINVELKRVVSWWQIVIKQF